MSSRSRLPRRAGHLPWLRKDFAKLDAMLTPDLIYAHSTGVIDDKAQYLQKDENRQAELRGCRTQLDDGSDTRRFRGSALHDPNAWDECCRPIR